MTKTLAMFMGAALLMAGTQIASASCVTDAAVSRQECLGDGPRDPARMAECSAYYRDDLAECHRYEPAPMRPMHKAMAHRPMPMRKPMPMREPPPPHH